MLNRIDCVYNWNYIDCEALDYLLNHGNKTEVLVCVVEIKRLSDTSPDTDGLL